MHAATTESQAVTTQQYALVIAFIILAAVVLTISWKFSKRPFFVIKNCPSGNNKKTKGKTQVKVLTANGIEESGPKIQVCTTA